MIVDITGFIGTWPYWANKYADSTGDGIVRLMDQFQVDAAFVTSLAGIFYDDSMGNDMVFGAVENHPGRLYPAVSVSTLNDRDNCAYLTSCAERGARMVKLYPSYHGYTLSAEDRRLKELVETASERDMVVNIPIRIMMNWGLAALSVQQVTAFMDAFPETTFLVENFNAGEYLPLLKYAQKNSRVYLATAALTRYRGIDDLVKAVGSERILGGYAAPLQYVACGLAKIRGAEITEEEKRQILGENAATLFGLGKGAER
ncbi:MAG: amidohydrolase [Lachnospiraceae bacterium]|nr:amidohydrolase [Lachnospiraceae bacterium]